MRRHVHPLWIALLLLAPFLCGCGSSAKSFIKPRVDFSYLQRAAVLPFENLTRDDLADERMQSVFLSEILAEGVLEIADPRETAAVLGTLGVRPGQQLTPEEVVALGEKLSVDAVFFGVVEEYGYSRGGTVSAAAVTLVLGLAETETGSIVWRAQSHETGTSFWKRLFGGAPDDLYEVSRTTVQKALATLL